MNSQTILHTSQLSYGVQYGSFREKLPYYQEVCLYIDYNHIWPQYTLLHWKSRIAMTIFVLTNTNDFYENLFIKYFTISSYVSVNYVFNK